MNFITVKNYETLSKIAANIIAAQVNKKPDSVLGFATGSTPIGTYKNLIEMYKNGLVDFSQVITFNLDEYSGLHRDHPQSYHYFMMENLFSHINVPEKNINILDGMASDIEQECNAFENKIMQVNGIDLQLLGIGHNGHIGFNEPDDVFHNNTRLVRLAESTIEANKRFFARKEDVPRTALSMGIKTIMSAKEILVLAGPDKAEIISKLRIESCSPQIPASILHYHPNATVIWAEN